LHEYDALGGASSISMLNVFTEGASPQVSQSGKSAHVVQHLFGLTKTTVITVLLV
jgi:hypothetical protein